MIEIGRREAKGRMTILTAVATWDMSRAFPERRRVVVAAHTRAEHLSVIHARGRKEARGRMTVFTNIRGRYVSNRFARRSDTVVTAHAVAEDTRMIEESRHKRCGAMAGIALLLGANVIGRFANVEYVVMTGRALTEYRIVIHPRKREPSRRRMTVLACVEALHVVDGFCGCRDPCTVGMTIVALRRGALKYATDVATLAISRQVRAL